MVGVGKASTEYGTRSKAIVKPTGLNKHTHQGKDYWLVETEYDGTDRFRVKRAGFRWHKNHSTSLVARCSACQAAIRKNV